MRKEYTDLTILLDRSGSMATIKEDMEGGLNQYLKDQEDIVGRMTVTFYQFDDEYEKVFENRDIEDVPDLKLVPRGSTALLDSAFKSITETKERINARSEDLRPNNIIFLIITDGEENSSKEVNHSQLKSLIETQIKSGWNFIYLGANQDAFAEARSMGIPVLNTMAYSAKAGIGVSSAINTLNVATSRSRGGFESDSGGYFNEDEKDMRIDKDKDNE